jgi:ketopantoate reductase
MKVLMVGAGVIGTVYGAHLAAAGHDVFVLSHGPRTAEVTAGGLSARDASSGQSASGSNPRLCRRQPILGWPTWNRP